MRRNRMLTLAVVTAIGLAACGGDDDDTADEPTAEDTSEEMTDEESETEAMEAETVAVTGVDYSYEGLPGELSVGTELTFTNASEGEVHELVLVRLPDDETRSLGELLTVPMEELQATFESGLVGVSVAMPGEDGQVVEGELTVTEPGRYVALCLIPTGADPQAYAEAAAAQTEPGPVQVDGGPPHLAQGMVAEIQVS